MKGRKYKIKSEVWLYPGMAHSRSSGQAGSWHFVNVDKKNSKEIKENFGKNKRGFGSFPVSVTIGKTKWRTSIFPDKKSETYVLPLKSKVRKKEGIKDGDSILFSIEIKP